MKISKDVWQYAAWFFNPRFVWPFYLYWPAFIFNCFVLFCIFRIDLFLSGICQLESDIVECTYYIAGISAILMFGLFLFRKQGAFIMLYMAHFLFALMGNIIISYFVVPEFREQMSLH